LCPAERATILQFLIESVGYDAKAQEVTIRFRAGGVQVLAKEGRKSDE